MWEEIDRFSDRLKVPGGWVIRYHMYSVSGVSVAMIFIGDSDHTWKLEK